ncbi:MAG: hypothetical protein XD72_0022 [Methanothrix harundinacea]|uniref:Uncharacterized protein n=1 Tax=Methanothrix harundinacea TaxID=301375 RepID=A0A124FMR3_9EURY|nr:MAG: hypothetical protein XD72_0022 [Methanothrix harundinacea]
MLFQAGTLSGSIFRAPSKDSAAISRSLKLRRAISPQRSQASDWFGSRSRDRFKLSRASATDPSARDRFASSRRSATGRSSARVGMVMAKIKIGIDIGIDLRIEVSIGNGEMRAPGLMRRRSDSPSIIPFGGRSLVVLHSLFHPSPPTTNP